MGVYLNSERLHQPAVDRSITVQLKDQTLLWMEEQPIALLGQYPLRSPNYSLWTSGGKE